MAIARNTIVAGDHPHVIGGGSVDPSRHRRVKSGRLDAPNDEIGNFARLVDSDGHTVVVGDSSDDEVAPDAGATSTSAA